MNDPRETPSKPSDLPPEVQAELLRRRDAVSAGEETIPSDKVFAEAHKRPRERTLRNRLDPVEWNRHAADELIDAAELYDGRQAGLGEAFLAAAAQTADRIAEHPRAFPFVADDIRRANLPRRWPYSLFFVIKPDRSVVIATLSHRKDLRRLRGRSPGSAMPSARFKARRNFTVPKAAPAVKAKRRKRARSHNSLPCRARSLARCRR